ncbi:GNAT family N-acetyltransferase [uncultured Pedobacter sp.]|uniref:GNAT family N-acetyltransferase n=1 Tax=uncultured Pedobacter sp. TaxID=246139 RepID=UPI0025D84D3D|nr:GNAT family N-acetyltransferase [uncultured Pedobacter sp.]
MKIFAETERLILRELMPADAEGMFDMNSDPDVHRYLGNKPVKSIEQSIAEIEFIRKQYVEMVLGDGLLSKKHRVIF